MNHIIIISEDEIIFLCMYYFHFLHRHPEYLSLTASTITLHSLRHFVSVLHEFYNKLLSQEASLLHESFSFVQFPNKTFLVKLEHLK